MDIADIDVSKVEEVLCTDGYAYNYDDWKEMPIYKVIQLPNDKLRVILAVL